MNATLIEENPGHRSNVVRTALIHSPGALIAIALALFALSGLLAGNVGAIVPLLIVGLFAFTFSFQALAALRDLRASPTSTRGIIARRWTKSRVLLFGHVNYVLVERRVFQVGPVAYAELQEGDTVELEHWPHTLTVIALQRLREQPSTGSPRPWRESPPAR